MIAVDLLIAAVIGAGLIAALGVPHLVRFVLYVFGLLAFITLAVLVGVLAYGIMRQRRLEVRDRRALSP